MLRRRGSLRRRIWHRARVHAWRREQAAVAYGCRNSSQSIDSQACCGTNVCRDTMHSTCASISCTADAFELVSTRALKNTPEFDTLITEENLAHIAQGVDEVVSLKIQDKRTRRKGCSRHLQSQPRPHLGPLPVKIEPAVHTRERAK